MRWLINLLRGRVTVEVTGAFPERLLNLCAAHGVGFWGVEWIDTTSFRFTVALWHWKKLRTLACKAMCELSTPQIAGLPAQVLRLKNRGVFWVGLALCMLSLAVLPQFILVVDVTGNETISKAVILSELRQLGVKPGAYAPALDEKALSNQALMNLDGLSFLSINLYGCRAEVTVREAEQAPQLLDQNTPADILSVADGIVLSITATAGQPLVEVGSIVAKGDILITGFMDLPEITFSETDMGTYIVHAIGTVTARTWHTLKSEIPLHAVIKEHTGREKHLLSCNFFGRRINFYQNSRISYNRYDKITSTAILSLPDGSALPLSFTQENLREYELVDATLNRDAAIDLLKDGLRHELDDILSETNGQCVRLDYTAAVDNDILTVTLLAECVEEIGKTVLREGETGFIPGVQSEDDVSS